MSISWMHLTDWHIGQMGEAERFPNLEYGFFGDLKKTLAVTQGIDLVFFTGDLVNRGQREEYDELESRLIRFWGEFEKYGKVPKLVVIPGNHDLSRPSDYSTSALALKSWDQNSGLRSAFWGEEAKELRHEVIGYFQNYRYHRKALHLLNTQMNNFDSEHKLANHVREHGQ